MRKGYRTTQRYHSPLLWRCEHFSDLKAVRLLHRVLYEQLELKRRTRRGDCAVLSSVTLQVSLIASPIEQERESVAS